MLIRLNYSKIKGVTLVEVMIVVAIIGMLCAIAMPNFNRMRTNSYRDRCITNLRIIVAAKEHWSIETGAADTAVPTAALLDPYFKDDIWDDVGGYYLSGHELVCPLDPNGANATFDTSYNINNIETNPTCKIDATHVLP
jgi:prepilin-type N-terminal cleavage/methylation domain-containing protein